MMPATLYRFVRIIIISYAMQNNIPINYNERAFLEINWKCAEKYFELSWGETIPIIDVYLVLGIPNDGKKRDFRYEK